MAEQKPPLKFIPVPQELFKEVDALARDWHCESWKDRTRDRAKKLAKAETQRNRLVKQLNDLINESRGVIGLHLNGDEAGWDWLIENEWLSALAEIDKD